MFRRVVQTFTPMQNLDGGFGGGHGQTSHCAASYAAILSLAMVGGKEALDMIERRALQVVSLNEQSSGLTSSSTDGNG